MWHDALTVACLDDYKHSPHCVTAMMPAAQSASLDYVDVSGSALCHINSEMYDSLGNMDNLPMNQRINKFQ